jgi:transposase
LKSVDDFSEIFLYREAVDMRKYRNGLCAIVKTEMNRNIFSNSLFIFTNKTKKIIRFLYWDDTGFAVWSKTLEKQSFKWPKTLFRRQDLELSIDELQSLLKGLDITPHKKLVFDGVI